jgi:SAM-dependent methyltransferase
MAASNRRANGKQTWHALALRAAEVGDLSTARSAFAKALTSDRTDAALHHNLAVVEEKLGEIDAAAGLLTEALRLNPRMEKSARRLSRLLARYEISEPARLDPFGLKAALTFTTINRQPVVESILKHLFAAEPRLAQALTLTGLGRAQDAARSLVLSRTSESLRPDLLIAALERGVVKDGELERLFTAIRRVLLLELAPDRFEDRALFTFTVALLSQGWNNDHAWAELESETAALEQMTIDPAALACGDLTASRCLLLTCLYRPVAEVVGRYPDLVLGGGLRPRLLRERINERLTALAEELEVAAMLPRLAPLRDETSRRVAGQYDLSPYPRWQSVQVSTPGAIRAALFRYFQPERLAFMTRPFDVLIAGAGTGQQALQSAFGYGPDARLLAVDLSAPSLAYAQRMAARYHADTIEFLVADILDLAGLQRQFDIIECVGVLHHMADPWTGWRTLLRRLKPGGLMYIGLYSAVSRRNLLQLRADPEYPGPGCTDAAARAFRAKLLERPAGASGAELKRSRDFYTLNEFRDLVLHEKEQHVSLGDVASFLDENGLVFRGFTLERQVLEEFASHKSERPWPGRLEDWARYEVEHPRTFDAMYRFWCERAT